jgi:hypothetical protein
LLRPRGPQLTAARSNITKGTAWEKPYDYDRLVDVMERTLFAATMPAADSPPGTLPPAPAEEPAESAPAASGGDSSSPKKVVPPGTEGESGSSDRYCCGCPRVAAAGAAGAGSGWAPASAMNSTARRPEDRQASERDNQRSPVPQQQQQPQQPSKREPEISPEAEATFIALLKDKVANACAAAALLLLRAAAESGEHAQGVTATDKWTDALPKIVFDARYKVVPLIDNKKALLLKYQV